MMRQLMIVGLALSLLAACGAGQPKVEADRAAAEMAEFDRLGYQSYSFTDYNSDYPYREDYFWELARARCGMAAYSKGPNLGPTCVLQAYRLALQVSYDLAKYCAPIDSYIVGAACLVKMALAEDLSEAADGGLGAMVRPPVDDFPFALGETATAFAQDIWRHCAGRDDSSACRVNSAARQLGVSDSEKSACAKRTADRERVECLIGRRVIRKITGAIDRLSAL